MQEQLILQQKKELKKDMNSLGKAIMLYTISMFAVTIIFMIGEFVSLSIKYNGNEKLIEKMSDKAIDNLANSGWVYIIGVLVGLVFIYLYRKKDNFIKDLTEKNKKMDFNNFVKLFMIFMAPQLLIIIVQMVVEIGLNKIGFSIMSSIEDMAGISETKSMFLYVVLIGPIVEEIVYRGAILGSLKKYGKGFAIIISAILFGVMHANLIQSIFAIIIGLVLGYVRVEYSIKWAILLHIINNSFAEIINFVVERVSDLTGSIIIYGIFGLFFIIAIFILNKNKNKVMNYIKANKPIKKSCKYALTRFWIALFILVNTMMAIGGIEKI